MTNNDKPIIVFASRYKGSYILINYLMQYFTVSAVVFEDRKMSKLLPYRIRKLGYWHVFQQLLFTVYDRLVIQPRSQERIQVLTREYDSTPPDNIVPTLNVESINNQEVIRFLEEQRPFIVVVSGTNLIRKKVLSLAPIFMNIHAGLTPRYRGAHGAFWAISENRPELAGVTVHLVDEGVDTGDILGQAIVEADPSFDTFRTLPYKQLLAGLDIIKTSIEKALAGELQPYSRDDLSSKQWFSPTFKSYVKFVWYLKKLKDM